MKNLKRIVCVLLCLFVAGVFSACGKKEKTQIQNPSGNNSDQLSLSEVLGKVYDKFDGLTKKEYDDTDCFSAKNGTKYTYEIYDNFVYAGIYMLKILSETDGIKTDVWLQGEESEINLSNGKPSKLDMLYLTREKQENLNKIDIYMVFHKKSINFADFPQSYLFYDYYIEYNEKTSEMNIRCSIQDSDKREFSSTGSTSVYCDFQYRSENNTLTAATFERLAEIDLNSPNIDTKINEASITNLDMIVFEFDTNRVIYPQDRHTDLSISNVDLKIKIIDLLKNFRQYELTIFNLDADKELVSGLTDKFITAAGAEHISDFIK